MLEKSAGGAMVFLQFWYMAGIAGFQLIYTLNKINNIIKKEVLNIKVSYKKEIYL